MLKEDREYIEKYGNLPDTTEELLQYIEDHKKLNYDQIKEMEEMINNIKWHELSLTLPMVPKGSPRPKENRITHTFYVKGAKKTKKRIEKWISNLPTIVTRVDYLLEIYQPTPSSMSNSETYLAEKKLILPMAKPDWDNVAKTFTDVLEGVLLANDIQINPGCVKKYYSIKPRVNIFIRYQDDFDCNYNKQKMINSIGYKNLISKE